MADKDQPRNIYVERAVWAEESKNGQLKTGLFTFSDDERDELDSKVAAVLEDEGLDALVAADVRNFAYLTGVVLPFADQTFERKAVVLRTPDVKGSVIICPPDWVELANDQGWQGDVSAYSDHDDRSPRAVIKKLAAVLVDNNLGEGRIGLDMAGLPQLFVELVQESLPGAALIDCDKVIKRLRMVKTNAEVRHLEEAARQSDRAVVSALNHCEGNLHDPLNYDLWEFAERVRVHVGEFGGSGTGNIAALQGTEMQLYYRPPEGVFVSGNLVRVDVTNHHRGYWSNNSRTFVVGCPTVQQERAYANNILLKKAAIQALGPGVKANEVYGAVMSAAEAASIAFWQEAGVGHGVGIAEREAPFLHPGDATALQPGMVLVVGVYTYGPQLELICSRDMYQIVEGGSRLMSWYKDWDRKIYCAFGQTARHG